jgi:hypothetical protein
MSPSKIEILKARAASFKEVLEKTSEKGKQEHVTSAQADDFNRLLYDIGNEFPDVKDSLPQRILSTKLILRRQGYSDFRYLELEIAVEQVIKLIRLCDSTH